MNVWYMYKFGLSLKYSYYRNCTTPYFINFISNRASFAVRGSTSFVVDVDVNKDFTSEFTCVLLKAVYVIVNVYKPYT